MTTNPDHTTDLDTAITAFLDAKQKGNDTGNYRRQAENVLDQWSDWLHQRSIDDLDAVDTQTMRRYAQRLRHTCPRTRRLMRTLSENADVPEIDSENGEYLELHGGRRGAGDTLVREVGWEQAERHLRHQSPETTMNAYSHISAGEVADEASEAFENSDNNSV